MDIICYAPDKDKLIAEAASVAPDWIMECDGVYQLAGDHTPVIELGKEVMALLRVNDLTKLSGMTSIEILGSYNGEDFLAATPETDATYNRLYPRKTVLFSTPAGDIEYTPPKRIGSFADA